MSLNFEIVKYITIIFCLLTIVVLQISCTKNTSDYYLNNTDNQAACKSCAYIPWCDSSRYIYVDSSSGITGFKTINVLFLSDTVINGVNYTTTNLSGKIVYHNCSGNITSTIEYIQNGVASNEINTIIMKSNEPTNAEWQSVFNANGLTNTFKYKIVAKSINRNVLGVNYNDVIQIHKTLSVNTSNNTNQVITEEDLYYASGIGLIEDVIFDGVSGDLILHRKLQEYHLP